MSGSQRLPTAPRAGGAARGRAGADGRAADGPRQQVRYPQCDHLAVRVQGAVPRPRAGLFGDTVTEANTISAARPPCRPRLARYSCHMWQMRLREPEARPRRGAHRVAQAQAPRRSRLPPRGRSASAGIAAARLEHEQRSQARQTSQERREAPGRDARSTSQVRTKTSYRRVETSAMTAA